jgi:hypothetical protein
MSTGNIYRRFEDTAILRNVGNYIQADTTSRSKGLKFSVKGVFMNQVLRLGGQNCLRIATVKSSYSASYRECGLHVLLVYSVSQPLPDSDRFCD